MNKKEVIDAMEDALSDLKIVVKKDNGKELLLTPREETIFKSGFARGVLWFQELKK